jgi:Tfp pilus assembly protein PilF
MRALKSLGEKSLDSLTPSDTAKTDPTVYRLHMDSGQKFLSEGRYFDAEDRFTRAISAMPNDPLAKAGRVHAQLGAGLFLSASTNLRRMIETHPEVVGLRFDKKLAPLPDRAKMVADQLRHEVDQGSTGIGLESSLLLAYLGRITGDQAMTDEGLADMKARLPEGDEKQAALYQLLSGVWGSGATPAPAAAPATPPAAAPTAPASPAPAPAPEK